MLTFVLTIWSFLGLDWGWSGAPTRAKSDVVKSISTIPRAPSVVEVTLPYGSQLMME